MDPVESGHAPDVHDPDYIAFVAGRILDHVREVPELAALSEPVTFESTPHGIVMMTAPDAPHGDILDDLRTFLTGLPRHGTTAWALRENISVEVGASERTPDLVVFDPSRRVLVRGGRAMSTTGILLLAEVTSNSTRREDLDREDPAAKPRQYAAGGIPLYLVVDRRKAEVLLFRDATNGVYPEPAVFRVGEPVWLPKPFSAAWPTEFMKDLL
ncbi:Uma2 family endonuclease (plasmid) [Embleya sp. NBC_00888]|uniref:Uma2 family endonuclease n=1 Tax=Embleya sp. NBC_00888 TaxID=2975960 RepID=UPI002F90873F|nr:Uma2 family endonuclease [Embleya sp. NBC_00888]